MSEQIPDDLGSAQEWHKAWCKSQAEVRRLVAERDAAVARIAELADELRAEEQAHTDLRAERRSSWSNRDQRETKD